MHLTSGRMLEGHLRRYHPKVSGPTPEVSVPTVHQE